jgi:hypothetical protein
VIKSISALGRANLTLRALPECRTILIVREPFGQVASRLEGLARKKFENQDLKFRWVDTASARRFGLTQASLRRMPLATQLAWEWAVLNEMAIGDLGQRARVRIIRYTDLVEDPHTFSQDLFAFEGLPWRVETERFIDRSISFKSPDLYYHVSKNAAVTRDKWRRSLTQDEKSKYSWSCRHHRSASFGPNGCTIRRNSRPRSQAPGASVPLPAASCTAPSGPDPGPRARSIHALTAPATVNPP